MRKLFCRFPSSTCTIVRKQGTNQHPVVGRVHVLYEVFSSAAGTRSKLLVQQSDVELYAPQYTRWAGIIASAPRHLPLSNQPARRVTMRGEGHANRVLLTPSMWIGCQISWIYTHLPLHTRDAVGLSAWTRFRSEGRCELYYLTS